MKKIFFFTLALVLIFIVFASLSDKSPKVIVENNTVSVDLDGYKEACSSSIDLYKESNNQFSKVENEPVYFHYIDDKLSTNYCDFSYCEKIEKPYTVKLVEFNKIGEKMVPKDEISRLAGQMLPVYQTETLRGKVRVDINYFNDSACQIPKIFSTTIEN